MSVKTFFDQDSHTFSYVIRDPHSRKCAVIDPVLDIDLASACTTTKSADQIISYIQDQGLELQWVLETHAHADHLTSAAYIKKQLGGKMAIGRRIKQVLDLWVPIFGTEADTPLDGSQFDELWDDGQTFMLGHTPIHVMYTPGHTPACVTYLFEDKAFVGDTLFMPARGTARVDFPGGSAHDLYQSIHKLYSLPDQTCVYVCHDYPVDGQSPTNMATIAEHKAHNVMVMEGISEKDYVQKRQERDRGLSMPRLILPGLQVNLRGGDLGVIDQLGHQHLKIPLNVFCQDDSSK